MHEFIIDSPIGKLTLTATDHAITGLAFVDEDNEASDSDTKPDLMMEAIRQLNAYFEGKREEFDLPLSPEGTDFQLRVWKKLQEIPYGSTTTYSQLSQKMGNPKAIRAIGRANGQNPIPIIIPCHRVIGANNDLVGYAGGIETKRWLLQHEGAVLL
ncbi:MAG: methylated-DNA--[protein]-cysteine S-methyltransferase [Balneolaceae bacterium]|nr:methylated-DNA--[protein]-cysteine S-methyltransferase [Balneolaceae bacterium]